MCTYSITIKELTEDKEILNACRLTVWKEPIDKQPTKVFLDNIYMSEHSPIRDKMFSIEIKNIKSWVATHFVRHHVGVTPYISTQRDDRVAYEGSRDDKKQGELVNMRLTINAQSIIDVSRKRLCGKSHKETREIWRKVINELKAISPELTSKCVPNCVYRGFCPEDTKCFFSWNGLKVLRKIYLQGRDTLN